MILSAHQGAYLPWPGYFDKINRSDVFVILDDVQFEKNSYINRNLIKLNDKPHWLTIPVITKYYKTKTIREIRIVDSNWRHKHLETIKQAYHRAIYYDDIIGLVESSYQVLYEWEAACLPIAEDFPFWSELVTREIVYQSDIGVTGSKQELIVNLCRHFGADKFLFGRNGRDYVDIEYFKANGIKPIFQEYEYPIYTQLGKSFVPGLSILDMLFNCGIEGTRRLICRK
ncbi:MAG: WbqC family protein [Dehalococcoidia bacterium]|jgi:hypothetical protein